MNELQEYNIVKPIPPLKLTNGPDAYEDAVVASVDPLVLVSRCGCMLWRDFTFRDVQLVGEADATLTYTVKGRMSGETYREGYQDGLDEAARRIVSTFTDEMKAEYNKRMEEAK